MTNDNSGGYNRSAALAIWAGTAAGLATMALHPTGREVVHNATEGGGNILVSSVHLLAILGQALVLAGAVAIAARLRARVDLAVGGYVFFALGAFTIIVAAAASGLIAPSTVRGIGELEAAERGMMLNDLHYTGLINQSFARISVVFTAVALLIWCAAILRTRAFTRGIAIYGIALATLLLIGAGSGYLRLNIHGYGLVVLGTGLWQVLVANALWRPHE